MKKFILCILIIFSAIVTSFSQEFGIGGIHRGGTSTAMKQRLKERLKTELKLTDDQANAVAVIQQDYQLKARSVKIDTNTSDAEKMEKMKPIDEERREKLKKILSEEQINKLDEFSIDMKKTSKQRQA